MANFFQDDAENFSMMRLIVFIMTVVGTLVCLIGGYRFVLGSEAAAQVITVGSGLMAAAAGMKGWQKASEARMLDQ